MLSNIGGHNIRQRIETTGMGQISKKEKEFAAALNKSGDNMNQADLIKLQQATAMYTNTLSLMSTMLKTLEDTGKEVIHNA